MPVKVLGLDIEREHVGKERGEDARDVLDRVLAQIARRGEGSFSELASIFVHGSASKAIAIYKYAAGTGDDLVKFRKQRWGVNA
jgi:hypothetical protein